MIAVVLVFLMAVTSIPKRTSAASWAELNLEPDQQNSINMLNYLTVLSQEINSSANSRVFLENAYSSLINNTYPNAVDETTHAQLLDLLDIIEKNRMITEKKERLQYIYEQNQAMAIANSIPSPVALLSAIQANNGNSQEAVVLAIAYMAFDSMLSYANYKNQTELQYLQDGWNLDDDVKNNLHNNRKHAFSYMLTMAREYSLPGDLLLNEDAVNDFVKWKNNPNLVQRIQFLEDNKGTYKAFGRYWITLASSYYEAKDYKKCISAVEEYEKLNIQIFRNDYDYVKILPVMISAAREVKNNKEYIEFADKYVGVLLDNIKKDEWALRYFAARTYIELYGLTNNLEYLSKAFEQIMNNVNYLIPKQREMNKTYLADIKTIKTSTGKSKAQKDDIKQLNALLKKERDTALPAIYEPLVLNLDLLYSLADMIHISDQERTRMEAIVHGDKEPLFLVTSVDEIYGGNKSEVDPVVGFDGKELRLSADSITENAKIIVTVKKDGKENIFNDWQIKKVDRKSKGDIKSFVAKYQSPSVKKYDYKDGDSITITIQPKENSNCSEKEIRFIAESQKWLMVNTVEIKKAQ